MHAVVENHLDAVEQRKRIAPVGRDDHAVAVAAGGHLENIRRSVVDDKVVDFEGGGEAVRDWAGRRLGGDEPREVNAVRQMSGVELDVTVARVGGEVRPGSFAITPD